MLVSAISSQNNNGYYMTNSLSFDNRNTDSIGDTSFNSLTPYFSRKEIPSEDAPIVYDSINQWKKFCEHQIVGGKLNIIA